MRVLGWYGVALVGALGCGSSGAGPTANGGAGGGGSGGLDELAGAAGAGADPQLDAAVTAEYRWSECGRIEPSARPVQAAYATDGSVLVLDETGRLMLFPEADGAPKTLLPAAEGRESFTLEGGGRSVVTFEGGARVWYAAPDDQPIDAATSELLKVDAPEPVPLPAGAADQSCADGAFETASGAVMTFGPFVCFWESATGPFLARFARPQVMGPIQGASAFGDDGFFTLDRGELLHVSLRGEVAARTDLSELIGPWEEAHGTARFTPDSSTLVLAVSRGGGLGPRFVALEASTGRKTWERAFDEPPELAASFLFEPEGSALLVPGGPILRVTDGVVVGRDVAAAPGAFEALTPGARRELRLGEQVADWDLERQQVRAIYGAHAPGPIYDVDVTSDGRYLASHGRWALAWELAADFSRSRAVFQGVAADISWYAAIAPSGSAMAISGDNVALSSAEGVHHLSGPFGDCASSARWAFSPTEPWVAGSHYSSSVQVYDTRTFELVTTLPTANCGGAVAFSPDGSRLVTASLELFETQGWTRRWGEPRPPGFGFGFGEAESGVAFSADGRELVVSAECASHNDACRVTRYRESDGSKIAEVAGLEGERVRYSPEGHWLVSKGQLLHVPTGAMHRYAEDVEVAAFTPQGDLVAGTVQGSLVRFCRNAPAP
jgi:hypothetical protein